MKKFAILMIALVVALASVNAQATVLMGPDVNNGSFESPAIVPGEGVGGSGTFWYQFTTPTGWIFWDGYLGGNRAIQTIGTTGDGSVTVVAPPENGSQFSTICAGGGYLYQSGTCGNFQADTIYTLTGYGSRVGASTPELFLGSGNDGVIVALPQTTNFVFTAFPTITIDTSVETGLVGRPIEVVCRSIINPSGTDALFDNIVLTAAAVPEPASLILLCLGGLFLRKK